MREILFRGKSSDNGNWIEGSMIVGRDLESGELIYLISPLSAYYTEVKKVILETVGQYTGLTDKNGKKIFEGDIIKIKDYSKGCALNYEQPTSNWVVKWNDKHAQFTIDYMALLPYKHFDESEVIGNIHDNPELLEKRG